MSVAVISSSYGGYDMLNEVPTQTVPAEWIMVSDGETIHDPEDLGWRSVVERRPHMHPRLAAKVAKCCPSLYTDAHVIVWIDASCRLLVPNALELIIAGAELAPLSQIRHPWRDCIYDEAEESQPMVKYRDHPVLEQAEHYRIEGHPEHWGLWATGMIVRIGVHDWVEDFGQQWLAEQVRWTYQDQISEAPLLREEGYPAHVLPFPLHGSGVFEWHNHVSQA